MLKKIRVSEGVNTDEWAKESERENSKSTDLNPREKYTNFTHVPCVALLRRGMGGLKCPPFELPPTLNTPTYYTLYKPNLNLNTRTYTFS